MEKIQLCFRIADEQHNEEVKAGILNIKSELDSELGSGNYKIVSCHLSKEIVEAKGFDPTMINFLHDTFGEDYINLCSAKTFEDAMKMNDVAGFQQAFCNAFATICEQCNENDKQFIMSKWYDCALDRVNRAIVLDPGYAKFYCTKARILGF